MKYDFHQGGPLSEEDALAQGAEAGLHCLAFDLTVEEDEPLHWHEFEAVSWVISVAALIAGGGKGELARARRALLLAGTPFYCLAVWLARFLTLGF